MFSLSDYGLANSHTFPRDEKKKKRRNKGFRFQSSFLSTFCCACGWHVGREQVSMEIMISKDLSAWSR